MYAVQFPSRIAYMSFSMKGPKKIQQSPQFGAECTYKNPQWKIKLIGNNIHLSWSKHRHTTLQTFQG